MKRVTDVAHYSKLLDESLSKAEIIYNHLLLPQHVEKYIIANNLQYEDYGDSRIFFCNEKDFYKLYCFVNKNENLNILKKDKPQIIECIYDNEKSGLRKELHERITSMGFIEYTENLRVKASIGENNILDISKTELKEDILWGHPDRQDVEDIYRIWESLDKFDSTIPRIDEMFNLIENEELVTLKNGNKVCAVAKWKEENRRTASIWLVAVDTDYRNRGLATCLYKVIITFVKEKGYKQVIQWCDKNNLPILNTISKLGFVHDKIVSKEYILF